MADLTALGSDATTSLADIGGGSPRAVPQTYDTQLSPLDEMAFRQWIKDNNVPFNPDGDPSKSDYDMRGFYQAQQQGDPRAETGINPNDNKLHYTDTFKTPLHESFSAGSQWAGPNAPQWINDSQLASASGRIIFDERKPRTLADLLKSQ
jgi:hypothetical protein